MTGVSAPPGRHQATVNWTAPASDGGSAITSYRVTPYIGATAQTPVTVAAPATSKTITGLTAGTAYTFKVAAINAVGTGPDSAASNVVTPTAAAGPGAPTAVTGGTPQPGRRRELDGAGKRRRQLDHQLPDHPLHRRHRADADDGLRARPRRRA